MVLVLPGETIPVDVRLIINYQVTLFNSIFLCEATVSFHQEVSVYVIYIIIVRREEFLQGEVLWMNPCSLASPFLFSRKEVFEFQLEQ